MYKLTKTIPFLKAKQFIFMIENSMIMKIRKIIMSYPLWKKSIATPRSPGWPEVR